MNKMNKRNVKDMNNQDLVNKLRGYAQGLITIEGLKRLNELIDECAHGNEGGNDNG